MKTMKKVSKTNTSLTSSRKHQTYLNHLTKNIQKFIDSPATHHGPCNDSYWIAQPWLTQHGWLKVNGITWNDVKMPYQIYLTFSWLILLQVHCFQQKPSNDMDEMKTTNEIIPWTEIPAKKNTDSLFLSISLKVLKIS